MKYFKKINIIVVILLVFSMLTFAEQASSGDEYNVGFADGKIDGASQASYLWAVAGLGCGCLGLGAAYLIGGTVPIENVIGKTSDYVHGYSNGYKTALKSRQALYAAMYFSGNAPTTAY
jgi:hypothetical protein